VDRTNCRGTFEVPGRPFGAPFHKPACRFLFPTNHPTARIQNRFVDRSSGLHAIVVDNRPTIVANEWLAAISPCVPRVPIWHCTSAVPFHVEDGVAATRGSNSPRPQELPDWQLFQRSASFHCQRRPFKNHRVLALSRHCKGATRVCP